MATSKNVKYSDGKPSSDGRAKFPWEYAVPDTPFWNDLPFTVARNFLCNYTDSEISSLPIDPESSLPKEKKLRILEELLIDRLMAKDAAAAPKTFYDEDYVMWDRLWLGRFDIQRELGRPEAEKTMRMLCERRRDRGNLSHFHALAGMLLAKGSYEEAEKMELDVKGWLESKLGKDCPQAFGAWRIMVQAVWKQGAGRRKDAERLMGEMSEVIEGMRGGTYEMYQGDERGYFESMKESLEKWDKEWMGK
jgi:hypothetical protein